jgi:hypothetical protein
MLTTPLTVANINTWQDWVSSLQMLNKNFKIPQPGVFEDFSPWTATFQTLNPQLKLPVTKTNNFNEYDSLLKQMGYV